MKNYIFKTTATMKEYNNKKWWIDEGIVREISVSAENLKEAIEKYREVAKRESYITISDNALKTKSPMYVDTADGAKQIGYVITGQTEFEDSGSYKWSKQYIDLWVTILEVVDINFETEA